jgi:hypothetical protein
MLGQLICVDRRYQRMNCFNIREAQSLLRKRFFIDLINTHEQKLFLNKTMLGLKFKLNGEIAASPHMHNFFKYGTLNNATSPHKEYINVLNSFETIKSQHARQFPVANEILNFTQNFFATIYIFILTRANQYFFLIPYRKIEIFFAKSSATGEDITANSKSLQISNYDTDVNHDL